MAWLEIRESHEVGIHDVNLVSSFALRLKLLDATSSYPEYKRYKNKLTTKKPSKWLKITKDQIIDELKTIHDNTSSFGREPSAHFAGTRQSSGGTHHTRGRSRSANLVQGGLVKV